MTSETEHLADPRHATPYPVVAAAAVRLTIYATAPGSLVGLAPDGSEVTVPETGVVFVHGRGYCAPETLRRIDAGEVA